VARLNPRKICRVSGSDPKFQKYCGKYIVFVGFQAHNLGCQTSLGFRRTGGVSNGLWHPGRGVTMGERGAPPVVEFVLEPPQGCGRGDVAQAVHYDYGHAHGEGAQAGRHGPQHHCTLRGLHPWRRLVPEVFHISAEICVVDPKPPLLLGISQTQLSGVEIYKFPKV
jgi:hypothetical protein